mmetsp:Transcript_6101/g.20321  ORF Transcript_6101/g.20321 Transcript_6101/m.20321 type:complete len:208 (-) Transcript_6101:637-1260(-)
MRACFQSDDFQEPGLSCFWRRRRRFNCSRGRYVGSFTFNRRWGRKCNRCRWWWVRIRLDREISNSSWHHLAVVIPPRDVVVLVRRVHLGVICDFRILLRLTDLPVKVVTPAPHFVRFRDGDSVTSFERFIRPSSYVTATCHEFNQGHEVSVCGSENLRRLLNRVQTRVVGPSIWFFASSKPELTLMVCAPHEYSTGERDRCAMTSRC